MAQSELVELTTTKVPPPEAEMPSKIDPLVLVCDAQSTPSGLVWNVVEPESTRTNSDNVKYSLLAPGETSVGPVFVLKLTPSDDVYEYAPTESITTNVLFPYAA